MLPEVDHPQPKLNSGSNTKFSKVFKDVLLHRHSRGTMNSLRFSSGGRKAEHGTLSSLPFGSNREIVRGMQ